MHRFALTIIFVFGASAQELERIFPMKVVTSGGGLQDVVTTIRSVGDIQHVSIDTSLATVTVRGTADQIALAEWLVPKLDVAEASGAASQEYRVARNDNDVVVVYQLAHTATPPGMQEILTTLRTVTDFRKIYMVQSNRTIALRGDANRIAMAEFLLPHLDQAPQPRDTPAIQEFATKNGEKLVVYGLAHTNTNFGHQEILTTLRTVLDVQRIYQVSAPRLLTFLAGPGGPQLTEWLIGELDRVEANPGSNEMRVPGGKDDVTHVFYPSHLAAREDLNRVLLSIRKTASLMKCYTKSVPPALVVRGTADQISMAAQMISFSDKPAQ